MAVERIPGEKMYIDWVRIYQQENAINLQALSPSDEVETQDTELRNAQTTQPVIKQLENNRIVIIRGNTKYDVLGNMNQ